MNTPPSTLWRNLRRSAALAFGIVALAALKVSAAPALQADHDDYFPGETIRFTFSGGPGNPKDWIGVYPPDVEPGPVASTIWNYVDGTQGGNLGVAEGAVVFPAGLNLAGDWVAYLLENDGYTKLATNTFRVVEPGSWAVRVSKPVFATGEAIEVAFTNGPANAKDWVGIYRVGEIPGDVSSTLWAYVDGTQTGATGIDSGTISFPSGLAAVGDWVAHFMVDDTYEILASETFAVVASTAVIPRFLTVSPANGTSNLPPILEFSASITNGNTQVVPSTIQLTLDGASVVPTVTTEGGLVRVEYSGTGLAPAESEHVWVLTLQDNATPPNTLRAETRGIVGAYRNIVLANPVVFENFDAVPEGSLPAGWTEKGYSTPLNEAVDFGDLGSAAYRTWTAVNADRFTGSFVTYGNPDVAPSSDYQRVLSPNPANVVNGAVFSGPFAQGRFLFGNSGYQNSGASQVMFLFTPDFDLSGRTNVHLGFKSLWEQNQDSIATIEYSIDAGVTWRPIAYFINNADIVRVTDEVTGAVTVDAEATLTTEHGDVARYIDDEGNDLGGTYGAFIAAPISAALAPYLQGRVDDNPVESKRVEWFRLPDADNQSRVRFRFGHAGTDSWYFGIDDFGLYAPAGETGPAPTLSVSRSAEGLTISWPGDASGYVLEMTSALEGATWQAVPGVTGNSHAVAATASGGFYRLKR